MYNCFNFKKHYKIENSIFEPKYMRHGVNVRMQNCILKKVLQICIIIFLHKMYINCFDFLKNTSKF